MKTMLMKTMIKFDKYEDRTLLRFSKMITEPGGV